jgi:hypothetical protein
VRGPPVRKRGPAYQPERVDRGDHVRERVVFFTTPVSRGPAYVLVPKDLTRPAPAVVGLHSHGGMFLFERRRPPVRSGSGIASWWPALDSTPRAVKN